MMDSSWILLQVQLMPQKGSLGPRVGDPVSGFMAALLWSVSLRRGAGKSLGRHRIKACLPKASSVRNHEARITACLASSWKEWQTFQGQLTFESGVHHPALLRRLPKGLSFDTTAGADVLGDQGSISAASLIERELRVWRDFKNN